MKMYICIKENTPVGIAMNSAAHGSLMCHLKYYDHDIRTNYHTWLEKSFKKVTCAVTDAEFAMLKSIEDHLVVTESRLNHSEVAVVLMPRHDNDWPEFVNLLKLWK